MNVALEGLAQTLTVLQQASALDLTGSNEAAVELYISARASLDAMAPYLPREHADVLRRTAEELRHRIDAIRRDRWAREHRGEFPAFPITYIPRPLPMEEMRVPRLPARRVFWLMRRLEQSMRHGAFLAPDLFVGREVWQQEGGGAAVGQTAPKTRFLSALCAEMGGLRGVTSLGDAGKVAAALRRAMKAMEELAAALEADIGIRREGTAARSRIERGVRGFLQRGQQVLRSWRGQEGGYELCVTWAINALEQAQLFERWMVYFGQTPPSPQVKEVMELLHNMAATLYAEPCTFLLRDMAVLVERYQTKCRKSAVRLLPVDVRLDGTT